jgi:hypothetical protein
MCLYELPNLDLWHSMYIFFADGFGDDEKPAPTEVAIFFDAGLQSEVIIATINFIE